MRRLIAVLLAAAAVCVSARPARADVQLTMQNGRVTIVAKEATVRQILTEWARVGQTRIVNVDRIPGGPITIDLQNMPEEQALRLLLRTLSGYMTAPRTTMSSPDTSVFDRIIVMPTLAAAAAPVAGSAPPPTFATFQPPQIQRPQLPDEEGPAGAGQGPQPPQPNRPPPVFVFPQPQVTGGVPQPTPPPLVFPAQGVPAAAQPQAAPPASEPAPGFAFPGAPTTTSPIGVSTPGMVVPVPPQQPNQPGR